MQRCPNGSRRNIRTKRCEKTKAKTPKNTTKNKTRAKPKAKPNANKNTAKKRKAPKAATKPKAKAKAKAKSNAKSKAKSNAKSNAKPKAKPKSNKKTAKAARPKPKPKAAAKANKNAKTRKNSPAARPKSKSKSPKPQPKPKSKSKSPKNAMPVDPKIMSTLVAIFQEMRRLQTVIKRRGNYGDIYLSKSHFRKQMLLFHPDKIKTPYFPYPYVHHIVQMLNAANTKLSDLDLVFSAFINNFVRADEWEKNNPVTSDAEKRIIAAAKKIA